MLFGPEAGRAGPQGVVIRGDRVGLSSGRLSKDAEAVVDTMLPHWLDVSGS